MKTENFNKVSLIAQALGLFVLFSCATNVLTGQTVKEIRNVSSFDGVALAFSGNVYITQGSPQKVEIEADKNTLEIIETKVEGNVLVLKTRNGHWRDLGEIKVYITMPEVSKLSISGSGDMICETAVRTSEIKVEVSGSGSVKMRKLESHNVSAVITGSGDILLAGTSTDQGELDVVITGSGNFNAEELPTGKADVNITGSGSARVNVMNDLETTITGSGSVLYKGNPRINANATGSGRTKSLN
jgi:hypothetical protein